ncbi:retrovirus-related pol polyprotein from transposon TNT 1-94 [Tanacetum coccineum]
MRFNEIYKFSDGTLTRILEALDYKVKEFKVKWLNPGMNTQFWTEKDVTRSKEFIAAIERRMKTRRIYRNLECFVGGRWIFNSLVHSLRALSTLRYSGLRTASAAAKPCQGDSSELYLITGRIPDCRRKEVENVAQIPIATTVAPGMFKLDLDPLAPRLLQNREAHTYYLKHTQEQADILRGIIKQAKAKYPIDNALDLACKHATRIQGSLVYVRDTCPNAIKLNEKKVAITPMNKVKKVRFSEPLTSSSNIKQVESSKTSDSNTPVLSSTGLNNKKNKVEAQPSKVNKKNHVKEPICDDNVKHTMLHVNSQLIYVKCKQCMFDAKHDVCFLDIVNDVNMHAKSKSKSKKSQVQNIWKPTGKVFTDVGLKWKPTGRFFTIVGNSCPLTRFTPNPIVPLKETTYNSVETPKPEIKVYSRRPKQIKSVGSCKKAKIVESKTANNSKPNHLWGSNDTEVPSSSSLINDRLLRSVFYQKHQILRAGYGTIGYRILTSSVRDFYENVGISHQTSIARTPQQNGIVERQNQTLVEAARTMLIFLKAPLFLWAEAINTACYTQNRSLICLRYNKTPYEMMHYKKPDLSFLHVFGLLCYPTNDSEDLGKLNAKADIGIFVGHALAKKAFRIYNRRTQKIMETVHVMFNELTAMASK